MKVFRSCHHLLRWPVSVKRNNTSLSTYSTDSCGIPTKPTWSVRALLSSYPSPTLSSNTVQKLYELSALTPPEEDTPAYKNVKHDLEEMIRLVEAVRLVDTNGVVVRGRKVEEDLDKEREYGVSTLDNNGQTLLPLASQTRNGFYEVESERRR